MNIIIAVAVAVAITAGVWLKDAIVTRWETRGMSETEQEEYRLRQEGVIREDGTIEADAEFDAELNAIERELVGAGASASVELDGLETEE
jgi:hypothetical protein